MKKEKIKNNGVVADSQSKVNINKVFGGYFSNRERAKEFIKKAIVPILNELPKNISVADFGGGTGFLLGEVVEFLKAKGFEVKKGLVVDGNESFLKEAKERGLSIKKADLRKYISNEKFNLIIQRAVLHYNRKYCEQEEILNNIFHSLEKGGFFCSQNSSGSVGNCQIRNEIVNHESLLPTAGESRSHL
jgi:adenine-specific DNA methylase